MNSPSTSHPAPVQPLLDDSVIALLAPTQVWSGRSGDLGGRPIHGVFHGDVRHVRTLSMTCGGSQIEWISLAPDGPSRVVFGGLARGLDDVSPDPKVRLLRERRVEGGRLVETWSLQSNVAHDIDTRLDLRVEPEFASLHDVKAGTPAAQPFHVRMTDAVATVVAGDQHFTLRAPGAELTLAEGVIHASWPVTVAARGRADVGFELALEDTSLVVRAGGESGRWRAAASAASTADPTTDSRIDRWLTTALGDLDALRLALPDEPADEFFAAGAPWFFTLFGRDSLWAARLALPVDARIAASTLRVLARLQGTHDDPMTAQEPGKILHELRSTALELPSEGVVLPPVYYGSVDSTPLWICLLADAWRAGMPDDEVRDLLPALDAAVGWMLEHGDSDGDGFLDYIDRSGRGLANQGWKDSGDSIQWRDGRLAEGPIALCEVQGYAYEAALGAADLVEEFGMPGRSAAELRAWAAALKGRFAESYWVDTVEGRYPAIALDAHKAAVDTLTSNIGHLLGTGILEPDEEASVAALLTGPTMLSGFGVRTMSTEASGYWPLSYHGGSVWTHDSAIVARGMALAGLTEPAQAVIAGLLAAAEGFEYRMPELHSGDASADSSRPTPYPAACRPQAWSAASAVTAARIARGLRP